MTASQFTLVMEALENLSIRLDSRMDRLEDKVDSTLERHEGRLTGIEVGIARSSGHTAGILGTLSAGQRLLITITSAVTVTLAAHAALSALHVF